MIPFYIYTDVMLDTPSIQNTSHYVLFLVTYTLPVGANFCLYTFIKFLVFTLDVSSARDKFLVARRSSAVK